MENKGSVLEIVVEIKYNLAYYVSKFNFGKAYFAEVIFAVENEIKKKEIVPLFWT